MKQDTKKLFIFLAICWLFINALWGFLITELSKESSIESTSTVQSKLKGCFVEELAITPNLIEVNGEKAQIREIWLEKRHNLWFLLSFIPGILDYPICKKKKGFQIVFTLENGKGLDFLDEWMFVLETEGESFANNSYGNSECLSQTVNEKNWKTLKVLFTQNWQFENARTYVISKVKSGGPGGTGGTR